MGCCWSVEHLVLSYMTYLRFTGRFHSIVKTGLESKWRLDLKLLTFYRKVDGPGASKIMQTTLNLVMTALEFDWAHVIVYTLGSSPAHPTGWKGDDRGYYEIVVWVEKSLTDSPRMGVRSEEATKNFNAIFKNTLVFICPVEASCIYILSCACGTNVEHKPNQSIYKQ